MVGVSMAGRAVRLLATAALLAGASGAATAADKPLEVKTGTYTKSGSDSVQFAHWSFHSGPRVWYGHSGYMDAYYGGCATCGAAGAYGYWPGYSYSGYSGYYSGYSYGYPYGYATTTYYGHPYYYGAPAYSYPYTYGSYYSPIGWYGHAYAYPYYSAYWGYPPYYGPIWGW